MCRRQRPWASTPVNQRSVSHPTRINTLRGIHQLFWEEYTIHNCTLYGQNAEFLNMKGHGTYHYQYSRNVILLRVWIIHISVTAPLPTKKLRIKCIKIFGKWEGVETGWSWLRIGTDGGHLWIRWWTFGFHKVRGISWLAAEPVSFSRRTLFHGVSK